MKGAGENGGLDYYPFGMLMPGRNFSSDTYDFGFNGKLNDNEVHGVTGGWQDYGMRMYDPRAGRFPSVDPLTSKYPWYSPYQFAGDKPIRYVDRDGEEEEESTRPQNEIDDENLNRELDFDPDPELKDEEKFDKMRGEFIKQKTEEVKTEEESKIPSSPEFNKINNPEEKKISSILNKALRESQINTPNTFSSRNTGTTNEIRTTNVLGTNFQINSGHAYYQNHETGNFLNTPLSMNQVENEIISDIIINVPRSSIPETASPNFNNQPFIRVITVEDIKVQYTVVQTNGTINISDYYPILK